MPPGGVALVLASLLLDAASALARLVVVSVVLSLFGRLGAATDALAALAAFGPWARALAALILPLPAGPLYRGSLGARRPSGREQEALALALAPVGRTGSSQVLVIDTAEENAWVLGCTLFVSRGLFESPHLGAVVAHEMGHLASGDGRIALAAWWLPLRFLTRPAERLLRGPQPAGGLPEVGRTLPQPRATPGGRGPAPAALRQRGLVGRLWRIPAIALGSGLLLLGGGLFPMLLRPVWAPYRRRREYAADAYAAAAGQGPALVEALTDWQMLDIALPWWQGRTHPYVEQRIDRLNHLG